MRSLRPQYAYFLAHRQSNPGHPRISLFGTIIIHVSSLILNNFYFFFFTIFFTDVLCSSPDTSRTIFLWCALHVKTTIANISK